MCCGRRAPTAQLVCAGFPDEAADGGPAGPDRAAAAPGRQHPTQRRRRGRGRRGPRRRHARRRLRRAAGVGPVSGMCAIRSLRPCARLLKYRSLVEPWPSLCCNCRSFCMWVYGQLVIMFLIHLCMRIAFSRIYLLSFNGALCGAARCMVYGGFCSGPGYGVHACGRAGECADRGAAAGAAVAGGRRLASGLISRRAAGAPGTEG